MKELWENILCTFLKPGCFTPGCKLAVCQIYSRNSNFCWKAASLMASWRERRGLDFSMIMMSASKVVDEHLTYVSMPGDALKGIVNPIE